MLILMHSSTGCTVPDEAIEPEGEGTMLPVPAVHEDLVGEATTAMAATATFADL